MWLAQVEWQSEPEKDPAIPGTRKEVYLSAEGDLVADPIRGFMLRRICRTDMAAVYSERGRLRLPVKRNLLASTRAHVVDLVKDPSSPAFRCGLPTSNDDPFSHGPRLISAPCGRAAWWRRDVVIAVWLRSWLHADKLRGGLCVSMWIAHIEWQSESEKDPAIPGTRKEVYPSAEGDLVADPIRGFMLRRICRTDMAAVYSERGRLRLPVKRNLLASTRAPVVDLVKDPSSPAFRRGLTTSHDDPFSHGPRLISAPCGRAAWWRRDVVIAVWLRSWLHADKLRGGLYVSMWIA